MLGDIKVHDAARICRKFSLASHLGYDLPL
jgi:hypothetical protein